MKTCFLKFSLRQTGNLHVGIHLFVYLFSFFLNMQEAISIYEPFMLVFQMLKVISLKTISWTSAL